MKKNQESTKRFFIGNRNQRSVLFIALSIVLVLVTLVGCSKGADDKDKIEVPTDAKSFAKLNYKEAESKLKDAGFTNITVDKDPDLKIGLMHKDGDVKTVTINGHDDFDEGDTFSKSAKIRITYHTFPVSSSESSSESSKTEESSSASEKSEAPAAESSSKAVSYRFVRRPEKNKIFVQGSAALTGHNGQEISIKVTNDSTGIMAGTYSASWKPGTFHGSDPDIGYANVIINGDVGNLTQLEGDGKVEKVTFKLDDTVTIKFFGKGDSDTVTMNKQ